MYPISMHSLHGLLDVLGIFGFQVTDEFLLAWCIVPETKLMWRSPLPVEIK